jgi:hypothetical protein
MAEYTDANNWGKQAARDLIAKKKPRSSGDRIKILSYLKGYVTRKYAGFSEPWKRAYLSGAEEELQTKKQR